jgi:hypothetical protein
MGALSSKEMNMNTTSNINDNIIVTGRTSILNSLVKEETGTTGETNTKRVDQMIKVQKEALNLFDKKNRDYGDAFANYGTIGVLVRMGDKISRLQNITSRNVTLINSESLRDTLIDLHNYSAMAVMLLDENSIISNIETNLTGTTQTEQTTQTSQTTQTDKTEQTSQTTQISQTDKTEQTTQTDKTRQTDKTEQTSQTSQTNKTEETSETRQTDKTEETSEKRQTEQTTQTDKTEETSQPDETDEIIKNIIKNIIF